MYAIVILGINQQPNVNYSKLTKAKFNNPLNFFLIEQKSVWGGGGPAWSLKTMYQVRQKSDV